MFASKRSITSSLRLMVLCLGVLSGVAVASGNIVFLDVQKAIFETEEAKAFATALEDELKTELDSIKALNENLKALQERLNKDEAIMSDSEKQLLLADIRSKRSRLEAQAQLINQVQQQEFERLIAQLTPSMNQVVEDLVELESYEAVLRVSNQTVVYINPIRNITRKVTEKLNQL